MILIDRDLTSSVIDAAIHVHKKLGPGILESAYRECLYFELKKRSHHVEKEKPLPLIYDEIKLDYGYRIDLLVDNRLVIEIKAVEALSPVHFQQLLTYLRLGQYKVGLLMNFHVVKLIEGIKRVVN